MSPRPPARTGLGAIDAERFNVASAVGGWRGVIESAAPTLVFVVVMAVRPSALVTALAASLAVSGAALAARLAQRQGLTQVLGGAVLALVSAAWAWRSGEASNFYATGLLINAVWLAGCLLSLAVGRPLVGILMGLWRAAAGGSARPGGGADADDAVRSEDAAVRSEDAAARSRPAGRGGRRRDPVRAAEHRRHRAATAVLAAMFALRLAVEVPLYLTGAAGVGALGVARLVLGLPLFALTAWFIWLLVRDPARPARPD